MTQRTALQRLAYVYGWRLRHLWMDTNVGRWLCLGLAGVLLVATGVMLATALTGAREMHAGFWIQIAIMVVSTLIMMALAPNPTDAAKSTAESPQVEDGQGIRMVFGEVWVDDPTVVGHKPMGTKNIRGKKSGWNGRPIIGYWYKQLFHFFICRGPVDALLEFRAGDKTAWRGQLTDNGALNIAAKELWGGDKTGGEGGLEGVLEVRFGRQDQLPSSYLAANLGPQQSAHRGRFSAIWQGGLWGAFSPYPKTASFKVRRILEGWEGEGGCWYPEKAVVPLGMGGLVDLGPTSDGWRYNAGDGETAWAAENFDDSGWDIGRMPFASAASHPYAGAGGYPLEVGTEWPLGTTIWIRREFFLDATYDFTLQLFVDNWATVWINGTEVLPRSGTSLEPGVAAFLHDVEVPVGLLRFGRNVIAVKVEDEGSYSYAAFKLKSVATDRVGMNPAHILYQSITDSWMGDEPAEDIDEASFIAAADRLYAEGFGLCTQWVPGSESVQQFQQRICNVIGASMARSPIDGRWHLDLIRPDYVLDDLPILTDDDIIEYKEQPATLDEAVNQVIVEWFDPIAKEDRSTAPVQSLGGIRRAGGVVAEVSTYREIPVEALALRAGARDLQAKGQPQRRLEMKTTRVPWAWRPGQRFRLQAPRRGIGDMVCRVGDIDRGTLRSGAISLSAIQDVYALPDVTYVLPEPGGGGQADAAPQAAAAARLEELPYALLASMMPPGEFAALAPDDAYLFAVATPAGSEIGYALHVDAGDGYTEADDTDWCATAMSVAACGRTETEISISNLRYDDEVTVGAMVLWDSEICRLDAIDRLAGTITLGRGCADTVPATHAAGSRLWILGDSIALDPTRYTGEVEVDGRLVTRTASAALDLASAPVISIQTARRQHRPYAPGRLRIDSAMPPPLVVGAFDVSWAHRDRLQQGGQLIDAEAASIGPEPGTTYTLRVYIDDVLDEEQAGLTGTTASVPVLGGNGDARLEVWAVRDGLDSWQAATALFAYRTSPRLPYADQDGTVYADQDGTTYEG
ncbi:phage tail protein [Pseudoxanthomonas sp. GW2]|uniref:phage tail protein n=1 Tax=Pseudoxanthomonas sp. GW2 TaxID=1211114 RepID=UPI00030B15DF|nr:phage tail protein [Pseudoxanthomonas sp. GW2]